MQRVRICCTSTSVTNQCDWSQLRFLYGVSRRRSTTISTQYLYFTRWETCLCSILRLLLTEVKSGCKLESDLCRLDPQPTSTIAAAQRRDHSGRCENLTIQTMGRSLHEIKLMCRKCSSLCMGTSSIVNR